MAVTDLTYRVPKATPPSSSKPARHFILALFLGLGIGLGIVAIYAYGTAEWWFTGRIAGYCALALVPLATALASLGAAIWVGRAAAKGHLQGTLAVMISGFVVFVVAAIVRVYPLDALSDQLPGYADTSPSMIQLFTDLTSAELPLLGGALGKILSFVYMGIEALVMLGAIILISRWAIHAPFCHSCRRYCDRFEDIARFASAPLVQAIERMQARDWNFFRNLGAPQPQAPEWLRLDIATCPSCGRTNTVTLQVITQGGQRRDSMVQDLKITEDDLRTVQRLSVSRSATYAS